MQKKKTSADESLTDDLTRFFNCQGIFHFIFISQTSPIPISLSSTLHISQRSLPLLLKLSFENILLALLKTCYLTIGFRQVIQPLH